MPWRLSDLKPPGKNAPTVLSTFSCGGGSSMGYKLAGFRLVGCVEIDPEMLAVYLKNLNPPQSWNMPIQEFNKLDPNQLRLMVGDLDILDGSPPCSVFSMAGSREKKWGKEYSFREGQATQRLDDLFFHFVDTARILKPKFVVAENVKGMLMGNARGYVKEIFDGFDSAGYDCQLFLLNSSRMEVPQRRERVFFISRRKDLHLENISMNFDGVTISASDALTGSSSYGSKPLSKSFLPWWKRTPPGKSLSYGHPRGSFFNSVRLSSNHPCPTLTSASGAKFCHWSEPRELSGSEYSRLQTFPEDYCFLGKDRKYVCGMSVPPYMMRAIASEIKTQWIDSAR